MLSSLLRVRSRWRTAHLLPRELDERRAALLRGARAGPKLRRLRPELGVVPAAAAVFDPRANAGAAAAAALRGRGAAARERDGAPAAGGESGPGQYGRRETLLYVWERLAPAHAVATRVCGLSLIHI